MKQFLIPEGRRVSDCRKHGQERRLRELVNWPEDQITARRNTTAAAMVIRCRRDLADTFARSVSRKTSTAKLHAQGKVEQEQFHGTIPVRNPVGSV